jgi:hypothetical protein
MPALTLHQHTEGSQLASPLGKDERESRLAEMLIGELLGPAQVGINQHTERALTSCQGLNESDRRRFRTLAENRQAVIVDVLEQLGVVA